MNGYGFMSLVVFRADSPTEVHLTTFIHYVKLTSIYSQLGHHTLTVADPGFPIGGAWTSYRGPWTPEVAMFRKFCMSK